MDERPLTIPGRTFVELEDLLLPEGLAPTDSVAVIIRLEESGLIVRELAGYLNLIDNIHGRFYPPGIYKYSQRTEHQVRIHHIRPGSIELEIIAQLADNHNVRLLLLTYLVLKYLPGVLEKAASAYRQYEEGRLTRERRRQLRLQMQEDFELRALPPQRRNQVIAIIDETLLRGRRFLPKARRFAKRSVKEVRLATNSKQESR